MVPRNDGSVPARWLPFSARNESAEHDAKLAGSVPLYPIYDSSRYCNDVGKAGSGPDMPSLFQICKYVNADSCEIADGKVPESAALAVLMLMATTRWVVESHDTPCHVHHAGVPVPK